MGGTYGLHAVQWDRGFGFKLSIVWSVTHCPVLSSEEPLRTTGHHAQNEQLNKQTRRITIYLMCKMP